MLHGVGNNRDCDVDVNHRDNTSNHVSVAQLLDLSLFTIRTAPLSASAVCS